MTSAAAKCGAAISANRIIITAPIEKLGTTRQLGGPSPHALLELGNPLGIEAGRADDGVQLPRRATPPDSPSRRPGG